MPVKYWSFAGLMLTSWCNARCASCYLCCGPNRRESEMTVEAALNYWRSLQEASLHGCRVHLSGGEAFGDWDRLIEICRRAQREGLGPLEKVETNAFWADNADLVRQRITELNQAGMGKLCISCDPYHQQFVPIQRCRLAAEVAIQVLGPERVQVRWRDWLDNGTDTAAMDEAERNALFARYAAMGRDRYNGQAANKLASFALKKTLSDLADKGCGESLLRSRHVHIDANGCIVPGTCAGIVLGNLARESAAQAWRRLNEEHDRRPVLAALARRGPAGLLEEATACGYQPRKTYAGKCHVCWEARRQLALAGRHAEELGPATLYENDATL